MDSIRDCAFEECPYPIHAKGYCRAHYAQARRGDALVPARPRDPLDRFMTKVRKSESGCWEWTGACSQGGYGSASINGMVQNAHRVAYRLMVGEIPHGLEVDHICGVRACVNPEHLRAATRSQNQQNLPTATRTKSGHKNVYWHSPSRLWMVRLKVGGVQKLIGYFKELDEAIKAAEIARRKFHPFGPVAMRRGFTESER